MSGIILDIFMETALDQIIDEEAEKFDDAESYDDGMGDIIDFLNQTESEEK